MNEFTEKYIKNDKINAFDMTTKEYTYMMPQSEVVRINQMLNLLTAVFQPYVEKQESVEKDLFHKYFVYAYAWAMGGLFENDDREKFHKFLESRGAPLPEISPQKQQNEKVTIYDYFVDTHERKWKLWEAENWSAPKRIAFSQLLIPTGESTRTEFIM
jgi:dynein heavy chain